MAGHFVGACCRCRFWPCMKGGRGLIDPKKSDEDHKEEETHLLATVIESDDEQADALSPDEIRRYLDESRTKGQADHGFTDSGSSRAVQHIGLRSVTSRPRPMQMEVQMPRHGASVPLANEYDELFDEESEDEPESVVVRAKPRPSGVAGSSGAGRAEPAASRRRSPSPGSSPSSSSSWDGTPVEANQPQPGSRTVLQPLASSPERSTSGSNNDRSPDRLLLDGGNASGGNQTSPGSLGSDVGDHAGGAAAAAAKDSGLALPIAPSAADALGTGGIDAAAPAVAAATSSTTDAFRKLLEEDDDDDLLDDYEPPVPIARRGGETGANGGGAAQSLDAVCSDEDLL